jgi:hypothetical protein
MTRTAEQPSLPIALGIRDLGKRAGLRLMAIVREVVRDSGKQESVATDLGVSPELLSQSLRSQRSFHAEWLPAILRYDHDRKILGYLAWESGCRISVIEPLTKGEKYDLLIAELRKNAADVEGLERRAYADDGGES